MNDPARLALVPADVPVADRLAHLVSCLSRHLPEQLGALLASARFEDGRAAFARLAEPRNAAAAVAGLHPDEAERLLVLVLDRWDATAAVVIDPAAVVVGPDEVWVAEQPRQVEYRVVAIGVADGWTAEWSAGAATLEVPVPRGDEVVELNHVVRVMGRAGGRRQVVVGERRVRARRPVVALDADGARLRLTDHRGEPAREADVVVGSSTYRTDGRGVIALDPTIDLGATRPVVLVDGQRASDAEAAR